MYIRIVCVQAGKEVVYFTHDVIRRGFDGSLCFRIIENGEVKEVSIKPNDIQLIQLAL